LPAEKRNYELKTQQKEACHMLYTVVPLERIYKNNGEKQPAARETEPQYKEILIKHGRIVARREGDNYVVQKIYTTDMSDYLNEAYMPGKIIDPNA